ncbi:MAG: prenyltransferase/squalene oxidase repeat-containing protein [Isosphaeraceae bacterium]
MTPDSHSRRGFFGQGARALGLLACAGAARPGRILADDAKAAPADPAETTRLIDRGVAFLRPRQDAKGGWSTQREPGVTALVVTALLRSGQVTAADPAVTKALTYLEGFIGPHGGVSESAHANYTTSIAMVAFQEANRNGRYDRTIKTAQNFLKTMQWDESEGKNRDDAFYGGAGYGGSNSRPDLSNTAFFIEALRDTGLPADDPSLKKAIVFVSRCQNLQGEFNDQAWASKVNDGGFVYSTAHNGESMAGKTADGGLRSYASMTYAGLKSMIYAGLDRNDPRVKAAMTYIKNHYTLDENPGLGQQGLYYYYHTFARTMAVLGEAKFVDAKGVEHDWKADLTAAMAKRQDPEGGWVNRADRFMEGDPNLVTAYALLALAYARKK